MALIGLCSLGTVACGDDDKDDDSDTVTVECKSNDDCKDASKPVCNTESGVCEASSASGDSDGKCKSNDDCKDASKPVCNTESGVCEASSASGDEDETKTCNPDTYAITCEHKDNVTTAYKCGDDKKIVSEVCPGECKEGIGCTSGDNTGNCYTDTDCKDPAKPVCGDNYTCVAASNTDLCNDSCSDKEECLDGICVSEAMKTVADGAAYPAGANAGGYCYENKLYYNPGTGSTDIIDCQAEGFGDCVVFDDKHNNRKADCNAYADGLAVCTSSDKYNSMDIFTLNTCLTSKLLYQVSCQKDVKGNPIAVPTYEGTQEDCTSACAINDNNEAACVNAN